jgi:hypothetical protein
MTEADFPVSSRSFGATVFWFGVHTLIAMLVVGLVSVFALGIIGNLLAASWFESDILAFCFVLGIGLGIGFLSNLANRGQTACWVWVPGLLWLVFAIWESVRNYDPRWYQGCSATQNVVNAFFILNGRKCGGGGSTLAGVFFTLPALSSIAYSAGAWLLLLRDQRKRKSLEASGVKAG